MGCTQCNLVFTALVSVSEEVRSRCHLKHRTSQYMMKESPSSDSLNTDMATGGCINIGHYFRDIELKFVVVK